MRLLARLILALALAVSVGFATAPGASAAGTTVVRDADSCAAAGGTFAGGTCTFDVLPVTDSFRAEVDVHANLVAVQTPGGSLTVDHAHLTADTVTSNSGSIDLLDGARGDFHTIFVNASGSLFTIGGGSYVHTDGNVFVNQGAIEVVNGTLEVSNGIVVNQGGAGIHAACAGNVLFNSTQIYVGDGVRYDRCLNMRLATDKTSAGAPVSVALSGTDENRQPLDTSGVRLSGGPGTYCVATTCTVTKAGSGVISASLDELHASAPLTVRPAAPAELLVSPDLVRTRVGRSFGLSARTVDSFGNLVKDVTAHTAFAISGEGSCRRKAPVCRADSRGRHVVTATRGPFTRDVVVHASRRRHGG